MAKIVSDSLIPGKANAPLDKRTEIDTLSDYVNIENPCESLVFYCKDTKKRYEVVSLVEETIPGTSIKRKVIGEYKEFGGLTDEQKSDIEETKAAVEEIESSMLGYEEIGNTDLDDVFDQQDVETVDVGDAPAVDFDSLA